MIKAAAFPKRF